MNNEYLIELKKLYKNPVGECEVVEVSKEVYEMLTDTLKRYEHAKHMQDLRHLVPSGYSEGDTEILMLQTNESFEEEILKKMDVEILNKALEELTKVQKERIRLFFYDEMSTRAIAEMQGVSQHVVWKSLNIAIEKLKKFFV